MVAARAVGRVGVKEGVGSAAAAMVEARAEAVKEVEMAARAEALARRE